MTIFIFISVVTLTGLQNVIEVKQLAYGHGFARVMSMSVIAAKSSLCVSFF